MSVLLSVRPLNRASKTARADSAVDSVEMPRISGRSLPENAVSGALGLMSSARAGEEKDASPNTRLMASVETSAWGGIKPPGNRKSANRKARGITPNFERGCQHTQVGLGGWPGRC